MRITEKQEKLEDGYILDYIIGKHVNITKPEEKVRQEYERSIHNEYHYPKDYCDIEVPIQMGVSTKKADIVIYKTNNPLKRNQSNDIYCIIETKKPHRKDGVSQLCSYMSATSSEFGVWTNGEEIEYLFKDNSTGIIKERYIYQIPKFGQKLEDLDRITKDKLEPAKNLKAIFRRMHKTLYSNANISRKEKLDSELMRLIFCKIHNEIYHSNDIPKFSVGINEDPEKVKDRIVSIWDELKESFINDGIFEKHESIAIDAKSIVYIVGELKNYSLTKTDKDVVGAAFEIFAEKQFAGEKGEFFTPRPMVKICVDILDPQPEETIIDPACGSGAFLIYAFEHVWNKMDSDSRYKNSPKLHDLKRFTIYEDNLRNDILIPRYYNPETTKEIQKIKNSKFDLKTIDDLIKDEILSVKGASSTASSSEYSIFDNIPFLRTSDLGVFETRSFSVQNVSEETYLKYKDKQKLEAGDILFVKYGTCRIGENIILTEYDLKMLVQSHFLIIKSFKKDVLNPFLLFYLINQPMVKRQIDEKTFVQATLSTIGDRFKEVILPIPKNQEEQQNIAENVKKIIDTRRQLRNSLNILLEE